MYLETIQIEWGLGCFGFWGIEGDGKVSKKIVNSDEYQAKMI